MMAARTITKIVAGMRLCFRTFVSSHFYISKKTGRPIGNGLVGEVLRGGGEIL